MFQTTFDERRQLEALDGEALDLYQLDRLNRLLAAILPCNEFYASKLSKWVSRLEQSTVGPLASLEELDELPFTFKDELQASRHQGDLAANLTFPLDRYTRFHQTSGTRGRPLAVLDTADDWAWWME